MIGEPDAGKLQVRFDEGMQETCGYATRLRPTLRAARAPLEKFCQQRKMPGTVPGIVETLA
jgi:hypothetical protein